MKVCEGKIDQAVKIYGQVFAGKLELSRASTKNLDQLAKKFTPLARRDCGKDADRSCILEEQVRNCLQMARLDDKISVVMDEQSTTEIAMDSGEIDTILLNLIANAAYWLGKVPAERRKIRISTKEADKPERVQIIFADTGPGIDGGDAPGIFHPGVTTRPGGMGMGLTVIAELVAAAGGRLGLYDGAVEQGAAFVFDLPLKNKEKRHGHENPYVAGSIWPAAHRELN